MAINNSEGARFFRPWRLTEAGGETEEERPRIVEEMKDETYNCFASSDADSMRSSSVNSEDTEEHRSSSAAESVAYSEGVAAAPAHWNHHPSVAWPTATLPYGWMPSNLMGMQAAVNRLHAVAAAEKQCKKLRPKKFRCGFCKVAFSNNGQLKGHERIHTGERPYKCDYEPCGKTFTRNEELTRHKRIHTGERPHACLICRKSFGRKDHLKKHTKTHENRQVCQLAAASQFVGFHYPNLAGPAAFGLPTLPFF